MLYRISVWLHILSATIWVGGMIFLSSVLFPLIRNSDNVNNTKLITLIGKRFRNIGWISLFVLLITGIYNSYIRFNLDLTKILALNIGNTLKIKIIAFISIIIISFLHDFYTAPKMKKKKGNKREKWRKITRYLGVTNLFLGLLMIFLGVILVRGLPI